MSKVIQVRNVPDDVHAILRSRAAAEGLSLSGYVARLISGVARRPSVAEVLRRASERSGGASGSDIVAAVRAARGEG